MNKAFLINLYRVLGAYIVIFSRLHLLKEVGAIGSTSHMKVGELTGSKSPSMQLTLDVESSTQIG